MQQQHRIAAAGQTDAERRITGAAVGDKVTDPGGKIRKQALP
jgi:hypothetical protein